MRVTAGEILVPRLAPWLCCEVVRREYQYTYVRWTSDPDGPRMSAYRHHQLGELFRRECV